MFDVNRFLPSYDTGSTVRKSWFANAANFNPVTQEIYVWAYIVGGSGAGSDGLATGAINPDLAADATALPVGSTGLRMDGVCTVNHMFEMTA
jgi:hypothetical protein